MRQSFIHRKTQVLNIRKKTGFPLRLVDDNGFVLDVTNYENATVTAEESL